MLINIWDVGQGEKTIPKNNNNTNHQPTLSKILLRMANNNESERKGSIY